MDVKAKLLELCKQAIGLNIGNEEEYKLGGSRFGGVPDVPEDFVWPTFTTGDRYYETKERYLSFLAQFNCSELVEFDKEHLLPDHGILSFFYELDTQRWGFDPKDKGCARVYYFEDVSKLAAAVFPSDMDEDFIMPCLKIELKKKDSYPQWEDISEVCPEIRDEDDAEVEKIYEEMGAYNDDENHSQLLGWPNTIQGSMFSECDLVSQGYKLGDGYKDVPKSIRNEAEKSSTDRWMLLFQLDTVETDDFELMWGDCGHIYFFIQKDDLIARRFDKVWLVLQCY